MLLGFIDGRAVLLLASLMVERIFQRICTIRVAVFLERAQEESESVH